MIQVLLYYLFPVSATTAVAVLSASGRTSDYNLHLLLLLSALSCPAHVCTGPEVCPSCSQGSNGGLP